MRRFGVLLTLMLVGILAQLGSQPVAIVQEATPAPGEA